MTTRGIPDERRVQIESEMIDTGMMNKGEIGEMKIGRGGKTKEGRKTETLGDMDIGMEIGIGVETEIETGIEKKAGIVKDTEKEAGTGSKSCSFYCTMDVVSLFLFSK